MYINACTMTAEDVLADSIGYAAAVEDAVGDAGERISSYIEGHLDGDEVSMKLPSKNDRAHHELYRGILLDMGCELGDVKPADYGYGDAVDAVSTIEDPDERVEAAALAGYGLELEAYNAAERAEEWANAAGRTEFLPDIRSVKRDEASEAEEFARLLRQNHGYTDEDFDQISGVDDVTDQYL